MDDQTRKRGPKKKIPTERKPTPEVEVMQNLQNLARCMASGKRRELAVPAAKWEQEFQTRIEQAEKGK